MKITTLIPTFRRPALLKKAIGSVLSQTYTNFEIWVCDNASGDETPGVVASFQDSRLHYHCHETNIGMIGNYQFSLSLIKTPFFSFLSDDDILFPNFFETAIGQFQKYPEAGFVAGSTIIATPDKKIVRIPLDEWEREGKFEGMSPLVGQYPVPTTVLFHSDILKHVSIDSDNPLFWDCDYLLQIASKFPYVISKKPCGLFLHHPDSFSNSQDLLHSEAAFKKLLARFPLKSELEHDLNLCRRSFFVRFLLAGDTAKALPLAPSFFYKMLALLCQGFPFLLPLLSFYKITKNFFRFSNYRKRLKL